MTVKEIKSKAEFDTLINSGKVILVDFWATWCGPCRVISPEFEKLAKEHFREGAIEFYKVDVDDQSEIASEVGIRAMPTFKVFKGGKAVEEVVGAVPAKLQTLVVKGVSLV